MSVRPDLMSAQVRSMRTISKIQGCYPHCFEKKGAILYVTFYDLGEGTPRGEASGYPLYDGVTNFFVAKADSIREVRWDDELKILEHECFFYRASQLGLRITADYSVKIDHIHETDDTYAYFRKLRLQEFIYE